MVGEHLSKTGSRIAGKLENRAPLTTEDLSDYCAINRAVSRKICIAVGVFILMILFLIVIALVEQVFGYSAGDRPIWIALFGMLVSMGMMLFQDGYHCWEIEERLYCYHCGSLFGVKDVQKILKSDCCPYCGGLKPILLMGFKKLDPADASIILAEERSDEIQRPVLSEAEFSDRIQTIQKKYQARGSIELTIFITGLFLSPVVFGGVVSAYTLKGFDLLIALLCLLAVPILLVWWLHASDGKRFRHIALTCPSCDQEVPLCVAERTGSCQHCGNKLFKPDIPDGYHGLMVEGTANGRE